MAAGDFSKPAIGTKLEVSTTIAGVSGFHEIRGLSNVDFNSPNRAQTRFELLNGRSVTRTGAAQTATLTGQTASNVSSRMFDILLNAKNNGTPLRFRFSTAPAEELYKSTNDSGDAQVAIDTDGLCTFTGTTNLPNFGGDDAGLYAEGHIIQLTSASDFHVIGTIDADSANNVKGVVRVDPAPSAAVNASDFQIVNPLSRVIFQGEVTQIGNISSAAGSAVSTDTLEISVVNLINAGDWTDVGYTA